MDNINLVNGLQELNHKNRKHWKDMVKELMLSEKAYFMI